MPELPPPRRSIYALALVFALLFLPGGALAGVFVTGPSQDTWLSESAPSSVHGLDTEIRSRNGKGDSERGLLEFDVGSIPPGDYVLSAHLVLDTTVPDSSGAIDVRTVDKGWTEQTATWLLNASNYDAKPVWASFQAAAAGSVSVDLTALVQRWVDGSAPNLGIMLLSQSADVESRFASRDLGVPARQPTLTVVTSAPGAGTADLEIANDPSDPTPQELELVTFRVVVRNLGKNLATGAQIVDALPPGVTYQSHAASLGLYVPSTGVWAVNSLAAGDSATLSIDALVDAEEAGSRITTVARVSLLDQTDPDPSNDAAEAVITVQGGTARIATGFYFGTGAPGLFIGTGFRPDVVLIKSMGSDLAILATESMQGASRVLADKSAPSSTAIVSLDPGGFTVDIDREVNSSGETYHWTAMRAASEQVVVGSYVGDGTDGRSIAGIGFRPEWMLIAGPENTFPMQRFATQTGDSTVPFDGSNTVPDRIQLLEADGFQLGADADVNAADSVYHFVAVGAIAGQSAQGTYVGNGTDNTQILDPGFLPAFVSVVRTGQDAVFRPASLTGDQTHRYRANAPSNDRIQALLPLGFEIGKNATVNSNNAEYHWIALRDSSGARADLVVTKSVDQPAPDPGDGITYTVSVTNNGPDDATGVELTDILPADVSYQASSPSVGSYASGSGIWTLGTVSAGATETLDIDAAVADEPTLDTFWNHASLTAVDQLDPASGDERDSVAVTVNGNDLRVTKTADLARPAEGDTVLFTVTLDNDGNGTTSGIQVTDLLPAGLTYAADSTSQGTFADSTGIWDVGSVGGGGSAELFLSATVDSGTAGSTLTNVASISVTGSRPDPAPGNDADSATVTVATADVELAMVVDDPAPNEGSAATFTLTARNLGPDDATTLEVTDLLPAGLTWAADSASQGTYASGTGIWTAGAIAAGDSATLFLTATVDPGAGGSTLTNAAIRTASTPSDPIAANDSAAVSVDVPSADLGVTKTVNNAAPAEGSTVTYTVKVRNGGPDPATNVALADTLPSGLTYQGAVPSRGSYSPVTHVWTVGSVAAADSATLLLTAAVDLGTGGQTLTNVASRLAADQADPNAANDADSVGITVLAAVPVTADLRLAMAVDVPAPDEGDPIAFTATLTNAGPAGATGVLVTDMLPAGLTYTGHVAGQGLYDPVTGVWTVGSVATVDTLTLDLFATVAPGTAGSVLVNTAAVTASAQLDPSPGNNAASDSVTVRAADVAVSVSADSSRANEGDSVVFTVTARNQGPDPTVGLVLTDLLPAGLSYGGDVPSAGTYAAGTGDWTIGALAAADSATLDLTATVDAATAGTILTNVAAVTATGRGDPDASNDADSLALPVQAVDLAVTETVDDAGPNEADAVTFTVAVHNAGPDSATGVQVSDVLPAGLTWQSDAPSRGTYAPGSGLWDVGAIAAADSAVLDLTATVDAGTAGQTLTNTASVAAVTQTDVGPGNDADSVAITVLAADLRVSKIVDAPSTYEGGTVRFTVTVENLGPDSTDAVSVLDALPAGLALQADSASQGSYAPGTSLWSVGGLAAGDSASLVLDASVDPGTSGQTLWNVASTAASAVTDPVSGNDADSASVTVSEGVILLGSQPAQRTVRPGETGVHLFTLALANTHPFPVTLDRLAFDNTTIGPGTRAQLDAELGTLTLYRDDGDATFDPRVDLPLATTSASGGQAAFTGLSQGVPSDAIATLFLGADVALVARDLDTLDVELPDAGAVSFLEAVTLLNPWPLAPAPVYGVNGMVGAQIVMTPPAQTTADLGATDALVLDVLLPANGYVADTLQQLDLRDLGTAQPTDIVAMEAWKDGGDGSFDAGSGDDVHLGSFLWNSSRWRLSGRSDPIPVTGLRTFVSADISPLAVPGRTIRLEIPAAGVTVESANDGPIDGPVSNPATITIQPPASAFVARAAAQTGATLLPGDPAREILRFELVNTAAVAETLSAVTFANSTTGPGTQAELDAEWDSLGVTVRTSFGVIGIGSRSAPVSFSGGKATFAGIGARIAAGDTATVILSGTASRLARDGDVLDTEVGSVDAIAFADSTVQLTGTFPLAPPASFAVNGMSAAQIVVPKTTPPPATILSGSTRNLSLVADIPANGYEPDTLRYVNLENKGTAAAGVDLSGMELFFDFDGDGAPEPNGDDLPGRLGAMLFTGNRWEITALALPVGQAGRRIFVTSDVADVATFGRTVQLAFPTSPDFGLGMASANDGPVDAEAPPPSDQVVQSITTADRVTLNSTSLSPGSVSPGQAGVLLLRVHATNNYTVPKTLTGLTVTNRTAGPGTVAQLDTEAGQLRLRADSLGAPELDRTVFSTGSAAFSGFTLTLAAGQTRTLFVTADVSPALAADGDVLSAEVSGEGDVAFGDATTVVATWPLSSQAAWSVDGMLAAQITSHGAPPATLGPGEGPALALDVTLPSNGYAADVLRGLTVVNDSTAAPSDLAQMRLWRDGGDGVFDAGTGDDSDLGAMTPVGSNWVSPALSSSVPPGGIRTFVSIVSSQGLVDGRTVRLAIPPGGVVMESGNDGPLFARVPNANVQTLSTAALLADLAIVPDKSTVGDVVTVTMTVRNVGDSTLVGVKPSALLPDAGGILSLAGGPAPDSLDLPPDGMGVFTWSWSADSAGTVRLSGSASGTETGTGLLRQTPVAVSGQHQVFLEAEDLELFPVESMPFSVSQGQTAVVPLSLTLTNNAPPGGSQIRVTRVSFRLADGTGQGIVPASLLKRVVVNEGTNVYADKSGTLETSGDMVDLPLNLVQALVAADSGQVTLSLSIDISDSTTVPEFRLEIPDGTWLDAEDATSGAPATVTLAPSVSYPVRSGLARVVTEPTELDVAAQAAAPFIAGLGQNDLTLLGLDLFSPDPDSLAADVRVSRFDVVLSDSAGAAIQQPSLWLETIRIGTGFLTLPDRPVTASDDSTVTLVLSPLLSIPANNPVPISIRADLRSDSPLGTVRLRLADSTSFDARDANSGNPVPVVYASNPVAGPPVTIVAPADTILATGRPLFPAATPVGAADRPALRMILRHPGGSQTGPVSLQSVTVRCLDQLEQPLVPATYVDRARALRGGVEIGAAPDPPAAGGSFTVDLGGTMLSPGETDSVEIRLDIEVTAPDDLFRLAVDSDGIAAIDTNLGLPVAVARDAGGAFPLTSGLTQLTSPARTLVVGFADAMPAVLAGDGGTMAFAALHLGNPAPPTAGPILVDSLVVRASDRDYATIDLGSAVTRVEAWIDGTLVSASADVAGNDATAMLPFSPPLLLPPGPPVSLDLRAVLRTAGAAPSLRLGLAAGDVGVVQPAGPLLSVAVQPASGQSFPFWTEAGNFSGVSLEESWSNFPNPFAAGRERTTFAFYLPQSGQVTLKLWTARGKAVRTLLEATRLPAGLHQDQAWDGRNGRGETVANGVYLAEIAVVFDDGSSARQLRKVAVVR